MLWPRTLFFLLSLLSGLHAVRQMPHPPPVGYTVPADLPHPLLPESVTGGPPPPRFPDQFSWIGAEHFNGQDSRGVVHQEMHYDKLNKRIRTHSLSERSKPSGMTMSEDGIQLFDKGTSYYRINEVCTVTALPPVFPDMNESFGSIRYNGTSTVNGVPCHVYGINDDATLLHFAQKPSATQFLMRMSYGPTTTVDILSFKAGPPDEGVFIPDPAWKCSAPVAPAAMISVPPPGPAVYAPTPGATQFIPSTDPNVARLRGSAPPPLSFAAPQK
eukprot:gnl/Spiro4/12909_TR6840_c0_g1_i1.p1 gnl/Spiro4/12909_TR6840_c0_g1~~gnl/Spiro4/12909_TR6840_c0_g1_i1.p1  ORF type:complete len:272 (+),score=58.05 gnl/Spiro4/12909_TR6840_c0_g1_i1:38-853(+)